MFLELSGRECNIRTCFGNGFVAFIEMLLVSAGLSGEYVLFACVLSRDLLCDLSPLPTPARLLSSFSLPYLYIYILSLPYTFEDFAQKYMLRASG